MKVASLVTMEMNSLSTTSNFKPPGKPQPSARSLSGRNKRGSKTYSSSEDDLHSDENLRPYETVKSAHHDKKLNGLATIRHIRPGTLWILKIWLWTQKYRTDGRKDGRKDGQRQNNIPPPMAGDNKTPRLCKPTRTRSMGSPNSSLSSPTTAEV
ncbi:hypothetical protein DPMN_073429 [Dreissena polymorpha]|uniref:Uncharacterized protein n=1 Tax=Dreissena polymorpha TaxID=45954 RepID=A0A9D4BZ76_DREPO|nr:hypothetical protein DPMN_073429 [Dreissena polymorpha]